MPRVSTVELFENQIHCLVQVDDFAAAVTTEPQGHDIVEDIDNHAHSN
jgi:hypothetical protein